MPNKQITLPNGWKPRPYQGGLWEYLRRGGKRAAVRWHRRSGKDDVFLHHTACAAHERIGNYWYMLPEYSQARKSMWDAVNSHTGKRRIDEAFPPEIRQTTREHEMMIPFKCGSTFQLVGSDNFNSLVGSPPVGLVFSEYALSNPSAWGYLRPILLENGGWAGFNSTPRGNNHFKKLCELAATEPGWFYDTQTVADTGVFSEEQMQSELRELQAAHGKEYGLSLWKQEYHCSFDAAVMGSFWGDCIAVAETQGRICEFDIERKAPVSTAWDLGRTDDTAVWFFQMVNGELRVIDHYADNGKEIPHYAQVLRDKAKEHEITYATHWLPHDARPRRLGMGGKSMLQQFHEENVGRFAITTNLDRQEGIQAARKTFPICRFHKTRCETGLESLKHYHREWDDETKSFRDTPVHDWSSHDADAFRYLSLCWKHPTNHAPSTTLHEKLMAGSVGGMTFGAMKNEFLKKKRAERADQVH